MKTTGTATQSESANEAQVHPSPPPSVPSQKLCRIAPRGVLAVVPLEPLRGVVLRAALGPLLDVDRAGGGVVHGVVRVLDAREAHDREAVAHDLGDVVDAELREADEAQAGREARAELLRGRARARVSVGLAAGGALTETKLTGSPAESECRPSARTERGTSHIATAAATSLGSVACSARRPVRLGSTPHTVAS